MEDIVQNKQYSNYSLSLFNIPSIMLRPDKHNNCTNKDRKKIILVILIIVEPNSFINNAFDSQAENLAHEEANKS